MISLQEEGRDRNKICTTTKSFSFGSISSNTRGIIIQSQIILLFSKQNKTKQNYSTL